MYVSLPTISPIYNTDGRDLTLCNDPPAQILDDGGEISCRRSLFNQSPTCLGRKAKKVQNKRKPKEKKISKVGTTGCRSFQCPYCPKKFNQRSTLHVHKRQHTGERPYQCTFCELRFADHSSHIKHRRLHTGERPYTCPVCDKSFTQSGNMYRHCLTRHKVEARK